MPSPQTPYQPDASLAELFARRVREAPRACAVVDGDRSCSYAELDERSDAVARSLADDGVERGGLVGVLGRRSLDAVVAILGIVKAGGAYVPLDDGYPRARLEAMSESIGLRKVIELPGGVARTLQAPFTLPPAGGDDLAYVMFTSGSTGEPKAVGIRQRGVTRLVVDPDYVSFEPGDRIMHAASLSFDASTFELWGALLNGACLVVAEPGLLLSATDLRQFLEVHAITTGFLSTAVFHHLARAQPDIFATLRALVVGGEALEVDAVRPVLATCPPEHLINGYGPTENTTFTTAYRVNDLPADATSVPIGRPIARTTVAIVRDDGSPAEVGEVGELVTGGDGVAVGYLNDPVLTAERFVSDDGGSSRERVYRTGDLATWSPDGLLEYRGRRDAQFKLHGHRIEPGEVEAALRRHPAVDTALVVRQALAGGDAQIRAYVTGRVLPSAAELRAHVADTLPSYMVPAVYVGLDALPLSPNGKVDRAALPILGEVRAAWRQVLEARGLEPTIGPDDSLFDAGGTSFDVPKVHARVMAALDVPGLRQLDLFAHPTLRGYSEHIRELLRERS